MISVNQKRTILKAVGKKVTATFKPFSAMHSRFGAGIRSLASGFDVNGDCVSCGICRDVCPAENVALWDSGPVFGGRCESCMACTKRCELGTIVECSMCLMRIHSRSYSGKMYEYFMVASVRALVVAHY